MGVLDVLTSSTPKTVQVTMCVDGKLQAEWDDLGDHLDKAAMEDAQDTGSLALPNVTKIVNAMDAIRERVEASKVTFRFTKVEWTERIAMQTEHPPRKGVLIDKIKGVNVATFYPAIIAASCSEVVGNDGDVVAKADIPDAVWVSLFGRPATEEDEAVVGSLNMRQVDELLNAAQDVNDGATSVPPSARFLLGSRDSGASLAQPSPGTSAPAGSKAGSRRTSQKSSGTRKAMSTKGGSLAT